MIYVLILLLGIAIGAWLFSRFNSNIEPANGQLSAIQKDIIHLVEVNKQTLQQNQSIVEIQNILKVPKARGIHGELLLEQQLAKLPKDTYKLQHQFKNGSICDAVVHLNNDTILPIDSKFSLENFSKMVAASNKDEAKQLEKAFHRDVKNRINEIRDKYILPGEGTLDFAFMYIPAENIYYQTFVERNSDNELYDYAFNNNIIPVSPNSLVPYLNIVLYGLRGLKIEKNSHKIHRGLLDIQTNLELFGETYRKAKAQLRNACTNFEEGETHLDKARNKLSTIESHDPVEKF